MQGGKDCVWRFDLYVWLNVILFLLRFYYIINKLFKEFVVEVTATINLKIDDLARDIKNLPQKLFAIVLEIIFLFFVSKYFFTLEDSESLYTFNMRFTALGCR